MTREKFESLPADHQAERRAGYADGFRAAIEQMESFEFGAALRTDNAFNERVKVGVAIATASLRVTLTKLDDSAEKDRDQ